MQGYMWFDSFARNWNVCKILFKNPDLAHGSMESPSPFGVEAGSSVQFILVLAHSLVRFKAIIMSK